MSAETKLHVRRWDVVESRGSVMGTPKILACEAGRVVARFDEGQVYRVWSRCSCLDGCWGGAGG